jgi:hypothetical protein
MKAAEGTRGEARRSGGFPVAADTTSNFRFIAYGFIAARSMVTLFCLALWPCR